MDNDVRDPHSENWAYVTINDVEFRVRLTSNLRILLEYPEGRLVREQAESHYGDRSRVTLAFTHKSERSAPKGVLPEAV